MVHFGNEIVRFFGQAKKIILDIFFPQFCVGCRSYGMLLCTHCADSLPLYAGHVCDLDVENCIACFSEYGLKRCVPIYSYDNQCVREIVHTLKYRGIRELGSIMAEKMIPKIKDYSDNSVLMPVPLHKNRMRERGFNQAEVLAHTIGDALKICVITDCLTRIRNTKLQSSLSRNQRIQNMKNVFACVAPSDISGKDIILIDDVMTTGATLAAAAHVLVTAGAKSVSAFVFARGRL